MKDVFVYTKRDYDLSVRKDECGQPVELLGVENMVDETSNDQWAAIVGWYVADINGEEESFASLSDALHAYDSFVVQCKGNDVLEWDINLPEEWEELFPGLKAVLEKAAAHEEVKNHQPMLMDVSANYVGTTYDTRSDSYISRICVRGDRRHIGTFKLAADAAFAYDAMSLAMKGEGALNFTSLQSWEIAREDEIELRGLALEVAETVNAIIKRIIEVGGIITGENDISKKKKPAKRRESKDRQSVVSKKDMGGDQSGEYVGIYFDQSRGLGTGRYQSQIYNCNKKYHLGTYILACDAARAYDEGARAVKGDDWKFNFSSVKSHEDVRMEEIVSRGLSIDDVPTMKQLRAHIKEYVDRAKDHQLHPIAQNNSCYIGLCKRRNRYQAALTFNKRKLCLGTYRLATDAARAYDEVTKVLRGSDAETNFSSKKEYTNARSRELKYAESEMREGDTWEEVEVEIQSRIESAHRLISGDEYACDIDDEVESGESSEERSPKKAKKTVKYAGVYPRPQHSFQAQITHNKKRLSIGTYRLATDAGRAYDEVAKNLRGSKRGENFISKRAYEAARVKELKECKIELAGVEVATLEEIELDIQRQVEKALAARGTDVDSASS